MTSRTARDAYLRGLRDARAIARDVAHEAYMRWKQETDWRQPYAANRIMCLGWDIDREIRKLRRRKRAAGHDQKKKEKP